MRASTDEGRRASASLSAPSPRPWTPGRGSLFLLSPTFLLLGVFFAAPLAVVVGQSLSDPDGSLATYAKILGNASMLSSAFYTFRVALTVTLATLVLAYPVAFVISRARGRLLMLAVAFVLIPFWTSTVIRTYAWMVILQRRGVLNDFLVDAGLIEQPLRLMTNGVGMQVAMIHIMLPFMLLPLLSAMRGIDGNLLRAASVLGANPFHQFWSVYLPLSLPGVSAGCILVFITSLGFYITPSLIGGPNMMIAVLIEQQASRLLDWPLASALATLVLILTCLLFLVYERAIQSASGGTSPGEVA